MNIDILWVIVCTLLVFVMQAGFLALEAGMTRAKNNIDVAMKNIVDFTISSVMFWVIGFPIMFGLGYFGQLRPLPALGADPDLLLLFLFQVMFCGTTVTILSGTIAERTRFNAYVVITVLISAFVYPVFGQWVWALSADGEAVGWLAGLGFYDFAGSTVVHSVGGWAALAITLIVGPRTGRFDKTGKAIEIPKSNLPLVILGVLLLWFGWFGFNGGSTGAFDGSVLTILFNTLMGGSLGGVTGFLLGLALGRRGDIDLILNGTLAGLVAITAGANVLDGAGLMVTAIGGAVVYVAGVRLLEHWQIDDVVGAIPVHLGAGIWGTLAVGLFGDLSLVGTGLARSAQILAQVAGIGTAGLWTFASVYGLMSLFNRIQPLRVTAENEQIGLNISEHGARTDLLDLLDTMRAQAETRDLSTRAKVEPFTQIGRVANYYNQVITSLEEVQSALTSTNQELETRVDEISQANKKLSSANEQIKSFANILSHDLRTPIASVQALIEEIQRELIDVQAVVSGKEDVTPASEEAINDFIPESLEMIDAAIEQMNRLTRQILTIAKEEARSYNPAPIDMQAEVQAIINAQMGLLRAKHVEVKVEPLPDIVADEAMVEQVFANLISNAIKYLDSARPGKVQISGEERAKATVFCVQDNGLGIPESQAERVFQLFRRVGKHHKIEGNGFGLFYIRSMLQRIDGDIWFESEEGVGTRFYVSFPKQTLVSEELTPQLQETPG